MDDTRKALLRSWLTKAANDLRGARILGAADDAPLDTAIYHCQQTAEKAVKAFLIFKELSPEKTHDIRKLDTRGRCSRTPLQRIAGHGGGPHAFRLGIPLPR